MQRQSRFARRLRAASVLAAALVGLAAAAAPAGAADKKLKIIVVSGPPFLAFFGPLKMGADLAAKQLDLDYQYTTPTSPANPGGDTARLLQEAASKHPDAIVAGDFFPDAEEPVLKEILKSGIPVIIHNSGRQFALDNTGVFIGDESEKTGTAVGERAGANGVKHGLCVINTPGLPTLEQFCAGYAEGLKEKGGTAENLTLPLSQSTNPTALTQAIRGALMAKPDIDGIFTLDAQQSIDAANAVDQAGRTGKVGVASLVLSNPNLELLKEGKISFLVDLQPFLQGYYSVLIAAQLVEYGMRPIGDVRTAPLFVTKENADAVLKLNKTKLGVRGPA